MEVEAVQCFCEDVEEQSGDNSEKHDGWTSVRRKVKVCFHGLNSSYTRAPGK